MNLNAVLPSPWLAKQLIQGLALRTDISQTRDKAKELRQLLTAPDLTLSCHWHGLSTVVTVPGRCSCPAAAALSQDSFLISEHSLQ